MQDKSKGFLGKFGKEIFIAFILAAIVAVALDLWSNLSQKRAIQRNLKAVAMIEVLDGSGKTIGQGSGFFINSTGLLTTNARILNGAADLIAKLPSGAFYALRGIKYVDSNTDIALLQFDANETPSVSGLGDSNSLQAGEKVYAIGNQNGLQSTVSNGTISNPGRELNGKKFIQFTSPVSPVASGGGLFSEGGLFEKHGTVIGITAASGNLSSGSGTGEDKNLNFAVPIDDLKSILKGKKTINEGSPVFYYVQGRLEDDKKQWDDAIENYKKAIELNENYTDAYVGIAGDYYQKGEYDLEVRNYLKATEISPKNTQAYYELGTAYEDVGKYDKAITAYKKTLILDPVYKDALHDLILLYLATGDRDSAEKFVPQLVRLDKGLGNKLQLLIKNQK